VVNQVHYFLSRGRDLLQAVMETARMLEGAFALGVINRSEPDRLVAARHGSPLVIGMGIGEYFIASDIFALLPVTRRFIILEEGDVADIRCDGVHIYDAGGRPVERPVVTSELTAEAADKAGYRHFMLKEIFSQPLAVADTLEGRIDAGRVVDEAFGMDAKAILDEIRAVHIIACGTSYHAGLVARYWLESLARVPCSVEIASEYRYRDPVVHAGTLFVAISQSGETADTLAALRLARDLDYRATLAICNVPESQLTRESDLVLLTHAGPEIGVASTKAFTTQLTALLLLVILLARRFGASAQAERELIGRLEHLPGMINHVLKLDPTLRQLAEEFADKHHALYLGRGSMLPIAMEGALKLKEISYIHAEAYAAGELKHGPLALIDNDMPVVAVAPNNGLLRKLEANLNSVRARGGRLYVFADAGIELGESENMHKIDIPPVSDPVAPIIYTVPLQLLAYHIAVLKGADVDQPRNLAKSVTVE
jgi:glucosamine--fructose-6-phosphate aminotransferase (isomerizing)